MSSENNGDQAKHAEKDPGGEPPKDLIALVPFVVSYDHAGNSATGAHNQDEHPARQVHHIVCRIDIGSCSGPKNAGTGTEKANIRTIRQHGTRPGQACRIQHT
jgi:hypothetical protein